MPLAFAAFVARLPADRLPWLYGAVPLPGEAVDFFRDTPQAVLRALRAVACVAASDATGRQVVVRPGQAVLGAPEALKAPLPPRAEVPKRLAEALGVPCWGNEVALDCLATWRVGGRVGSRVGGGWWVALQGPLLFTRAFG